MQFTRASLTLCIHSVAVDSREAEKEVEKTGWHFVNQINLAVVVAASQEELPTIDVKKELLQVVGNRMSGLHLLLLTFMKVSP